MTDAEALHQLQVWTRANRDLTRRRDAATAAVREALRTDFEVEDYGGPSSGVRWRLSPDRPDGFALVLHPCSRVTEGASFQGATLGSVVEQACTQVGPMYEAETASVEKLEAMAAAASIARVPE